MSKLRFWIPAVTSVLAAASTIAVAVAPGEGPAEARAVLVAGFALLAALMAWMAWAARGAR